MTKLGKRLEPLRAEVQVHWSDERARRVERALGRRRKRRAVLQTAGGAVAIVAILLSIRALLPTPAPHTPPRLVETSIGRDFGLRDGSWVKLHDAASQIAEVPISAVEGDRQLMAIELSRGTAHFQVVRDPARLFRVRSGHVIVEVLGTSFTVEKFGMRSRVEVERGRVHVSWPGGQTELGAGENGIFPPEHQAAGPVAPDPQSLCLPSPAASAPKPAAAPQNVVVRQQPEPAPKLANPGPEWILLAREGQFDSAYQALMQRGLGAVRDPDELLLAADVARLSRHPGTALAPLRRVLREHPSDPRSSLAAFTLGRTLLEDLGQPREAAEVFRSIADSDRHTPLIEDALAREVEAWSRAGDVVRARERALLYLRRFPDGDRQRSVRRHGGLER